jgi:hypothetical protein
VPLIFVKEDMGITAAAIGVIVWWRVRQETDLEPEAESAPGQEPAPVLAPGGEPEPSAVPRQNGAGEFNGHVDRADHADEDTGDETADSERDGRIGAGVERISDALRYGPWAIGLVSFGVAASALAFAVIIPAFNNAGGYDYWNKLNGDGAPMPGHIPFGTAFHTLLWILLPTSGLLALRSPLIMAALPTIGWRFVSHDDHYWGTDWHYSAVLMPVVFLALVDAADRSRSSRMPWLRSYASGAPAAVAGASLALTLTLPLASLDQGSTYEVDAHTKAVEKLLDEIPDGATVEANVGPISRLVHRTTVYWVGDTPGVTPDYIALDNSTGWVPDPAQYAVQLHPAATYQVIANSEGYVILHRTS